MKSGRYSVFPFRRVYPRRSADIYQDIFDIDEIAEYISTFSDQHLSASKLYFSVLLHLLDVYKAKSTFPHEQLQTHFIAIFYKINWSKLITTIYLFTFVLVKFPQEFHEILLDELEINLEKFVASARLADIFPLLPNNLIKLIEKLEDNIIRVMGGNLNTLFGLLCCLDSLNRVATLTYFLRYYPGVFPKKSDVLKCIKFLDEIDRCVFINDIFNQLPILIESADDLVIVLENMDQARRAELLLLLKDKSLVLFAIYGANNKIQYALSDEEKLLLRKPTPPAVVKPAYTSRPTLTVFSPNPLENKEPKERKEPREPKESRHKGSCTLI